MIEKYARHNGHADLIRERIDGATGDRRPGRHRQRVLTTSPSQRQKGRFTRPANCARRIEPGRFKQA
jgi:Protein of unknown function (DUF664)